MLKSRRQIKSFKINPNLVLKLKASDISTSDPRNTQRHKILIKIFQMYFTVNRS